MKDFDTELRLKAIRSGAVLTSAALVIAIFTDMVGFLPSGSLTNVPC